MPLLKPPPGIQIKKHPLARGLVAGWLMNERSGATIYDISGYGNAGSFAGDPQWVAGKYGSALDFDGNDHVGVGPGVLPSGPKTLVMSAQAPVSSDTRDKAMYRGYDGTAYWWLYYNDGTHYRAYYAGAGGYSVTYTVDIRDGKHHQIVFTYDGTTAKLYHDGIYRSSDTGNDHGPITSDESISPNLPGQDAWKGLIDYVFIYNRALTASEIAWLYREPFAMFECPTSIALLSYAEAAGEGIAILRRRRAG